MTEGEPASTLARRRGFQNGGPIVCGSKCRTQPPKLALFAGKAQFFLLDSQKNAQLPCAPGSSHTASRTIKATGAGDHHANPDPGNGKLILVVVRRRCSARSPFLMISRNSIDFLRRLIQRQKAVHQEKETEAAGPRRRPAPLAAPALPERIDTPRAQNSRPTISKTSATRAGARL